MLISFVLGMETGGSTLSLRTKLNLVGATREAVGGCGKTWKWGKFSHLKYDERFASEIISWTATGYRIGSLYEIRKSLILVSGINPRVCGDLHYTKVTSVPKVLL